MNLRTRSILHLGILFIILFVLITVVFLTVTLSGLDRIEYQYTADAVTQTNTALASESQSLLSTTQDWAWWDEMAAYARGEDPQFAGRNANPANLKTVRIHLLIITDSRGEILYSTLLSPDFSMNTSVPSDYWSIIRTTPGLTLHNADDPGITGMISLPGGPMVISSAPILMSDMSGPSRGSIILGRYLEYGPRQKITGITGYDFNIVWEDAVKGNQPGDIPALPEDEHLVVVPANESVAFGNSTITDLTGKRLVLSVLVPRDLYQIGVANITTNLVLLAIWAFLTGIVLVLILDREVLKRLDLLSRRVSTLSGESENTLAPVLAVNDEFTALEQLILTYRQDTITRGRQLQALLDAMPDPAALYTRDGTIILANTALAVYLGKSRDELTGTKIRDHLSQEEYRNYRQQAQEAITKKTMIQYEVEGGGKTLLLSHYPVLDLQGEVAQIGILTFDISERRRLFDALQKVNKKIALLNTVIFTDIQNKIFVQRGYQELLRSISTDPKIRDYLGKEELAVEEIQASLRFAKQYNDMGANPPRWQNVQDVFLFAISHLDPGKLRRDFQLTGLEIFADTLLERVFLSLVENVVQHAEGATQFRAAYSITDGNLVLVFEDDGRGIPLENKERIFNKGAGTSGAVGLFLAREILSITGITIRETGEPGKGARFEILVPKGAYRIYGK